MKYEPSNPDEDDIFLDKALKIRQIYEIEIFSPTIKEGEFKSFNTAIGINKTRCKVYLSVKKGSILESIPDLENKLSEYINKQKIRAKLLIDVFDMPQEKIISQLSFKAITAGELLFEQNTTYLISQSLEPMDTINDRLIKHYLKQDEIDEDDKVDYAKRGFIKSVVEGELLMEYIKAKDGKPGRDCYGKYIEPKKAEIKNKPTFLIDSTIEEKSEDDAIKYIANKNGYISFKDKMCSIKSELDIGSINFKKTGHITTDKGSEITLNVNEEDSVKDAVGNGMKVDV